MQGAESGTDYVRRLTRRCRSGMGKARQARQALHVSLCLCDELTRLCSAWRSVMLAPTRTVALAVVYALVPSMDVSSRLAAMCALCGRRSVVPRWPVSSAAWYTWLHAQRRPHVRAMVSGVLQSWDRAGLVHMHGCLGSAQHELGTEPRLLTSYRTSRAAAVPRSRSQHHRTAVLLVSQRQHSLTTPTDHVVYTAYRPLLTPKIVPNV